MMADANRIMTEEDQESNQRETLSDPCHLEVAQQGAGCRTVGARQTQ